MTWIAAWAAAVIVLRTAPTRALNRRLAVILALEGLWQGGSTGLVFLVNSRNAAFTIAAIGTMAQSVTPFQYLAFLGIALETPLVKPFRSRLVMRALNAATILAGAAVLLWPQHFITEPYHPGWATWNFQTRELGVVTTQIHGIIAMFGLLAALSAYWLTPRGTAARTRAKWFAIAFGAVDAYMATFQVLYPYVRPVRFWGDFIYNPGSGLAILVFVLLLAYGVLHAQLFDIDLRLKIALQRSTIAALIAGAFFVGDNVLQGLVPVHGVLLGLLSSAVIVLALRPLHRLVEQLANRLMPGVAPTAEYLDQRKIEVYRAAYEGALQDGIVTERERAILVRLAQHLELSAAAIAQAERDLSAQAV